MLGTSVKMKKPSNSNTISSSFPHSYNLTRVR